MELLIKITTKEPVRTIKVGLSNQTILLLLVFLLLINKGWTQQNVQVLQTAGSGNWSCPSSATNVQIELWGAGGAGGGTSGKTGLAGGGGAGGAYVNNYPIPVSGGNYQYTVGSGAGGSIGRNTNIVIGSGIQASGGNSGGQGSTGVNGVGGVGSTTNCYGIGGSIFIMYPGGNGATGLLSSYGGGGGGAAGSTGIGGSANASSGGISPVGSVSGTGGNGQTNSVSAAPGNAPGGGGGGGYVYTGSTPAVGANGGDGYIKITYLAPPVQGAISLSGSGTSLNITVSGGNGFKRVIFLEDGTDAFPIIPAASNTLYTASATDNSGTPCGTSNYHCVYNGSGNSVTVSNLVVGHTYSICSFEYSGCSTSNYYLYNTTNNLRVQALSPITGYLPNNGGTLTGALTITPASGTGSGLQLTNLNSSSSAYTGSQVPLAVDESGNVVAGKSQTFGTCSGGFLPICGGHITNNLGVGTSSFLNTTSTSGITTPQIGTFLQVGQDETVTNPSAVYIGNCGSANSKPTAQFAANWSSDGRWGIGPTSTSTPNLLDANGKPYDIIKTIKIGRVNSDMTWATNNDGSEDGQISFAVDGRLRVSNDKGPAPMNSSQIEFYYNQSDNIGYIESTTRGALVHDQIPCTFNNLSLNRLFNVIGNAGVGIGTTNLHNYQLAVNGTIGAKKVKVTAGPWPDYVFSKTYKLPSLQSVEQYIAQNNHLPDVPSAATVAKDGLDLGDNQAVMLKKIEELTLYLIKQQKEIEELKEEIKKK